MEKEDVKVLKGGLNPSGVLSEKFIQGKVTDTRLMGVVGLSMIWELSLDGSEAPSFHHILIYFDYEEIGLDSIKIFPYIDRSFTEIAERSSFGGLGAKYIEVSEDECRFLTAWFIKKNREMGLKANANEEKIGYIWKKARELSESELAALNSKICVPLLSDYAIINYFLMRSFGCDFEGANLLAKEKFKDEDLKSISFDKPSAFLVNRIEASPDGGNSYLCESIIEGEISHIRQTTQLSLAGSKVESFDLLSRCEITLDEASLILAKGEYVLHYNVLGDGKLFDTVFVPFTLGCTINNHDTGNMFMEFNKDNSHVERRVFRLADDVHAIYYLTDYGQLLVGAYNEKDISEVENRLRSFGVSKYLELEERYYFANSIIYDFATSGCPDFKEFVEECED